MEFLFSLIFIFGEAPVVALIITLFLSWVILFASIRMVYKIGLFIAMVFVSVSRVLAVYLSALALDDNYQHYENAKRLVFWTTSDIYFQLAWPIIVLIALLLLCFNIKRAWVLVVCVLGVVGIFLSAEYTVYTMQNQEDIQYHQDQQKQLNYEQHAIPSLRLDPNFFNYSSTVYDIDLYVNPNYNDISSITLELFPDPNLIASVSLVPLESGNSQSFFQSNIQTSLKVDGPLHVIYTISGINGAKESTDIDSRLIGHLHVILKEKPSLNKYIQVIFANSILTSTRTDGKKRSETYTPLDPLYFAINAEK